MENTVTPPLISNTPIHDATPAITPFLFTWVHLYKDGSVYMKVWTFVFKTT